MRFLAGCSRSVRVLVLAVTAFLVASSGVASAADLYFHGMADDQAQKQTSFVNGTPPPPGNLTFGPGGPNPANPTPIRQVMGNPNSEFIPNELAVWWVGDFSGTINGQIRMDWTWETTNELGVLVGVDVSIKVVADPDFANPGVGTQNVIGETATSWSFGSVNTPATFTTMIPVNGTVSSRLLIQVATEFVDTGPGLAALYDHADAPSRWNPFPAASGACCDPTSASCTEMSSEACAAAKGIFQGAGTTCSSSPCTIVTPCVLPGILTLVDPAGSEDAPPVTDPQQDLRSVSVAEPHGDPLGEVFVFTMKMASLDPAALPPNTLWRTFFESSVGGRFFVAAVHCATGGVFYEYGHAEDTGTVTDGPADRGTMAADGTIQITVRKNRFTGLGAGQIMSEVAADVRTIVGDCPPNNAAFAPIDTSTPTTYLIRGTAYCLPPTVSCPEDFTGEPGEYPVDFTIHNPSTASRTYRVTLTDPQGWLESFPIVDVLFGPVAPGSSSSLSGMLRMTGPCNPPVEDVLGWSVTALDLPAPSNVATCQTVATCEQTTTGVGGGPAGAFSFGMVGPNPFRGEGRFRYTLPAPGRVKVEVFGVRGERLRTLVDREHDAGVHDVSLRLGDGGRGALPAGVYLVRITAGQEVRSLRVIGLN